MTSLFSPIAIRGLELPNRLWLSPMCQYSVEQQDGVPTDWHLANLGSFARAGWGLLMTEATAVTADGRISPQDTGIWSDGQADAWSRITRFAHSQGAVIGIQLAHAGRKASTFRPWAAERGTVPPSEGGWPTVAPSAIPFGWYAPPRALAAAELPDLIAAFAAAARRAIDAGFDLVEVHAAHGYLLHEFLSPLSNQRDDAYGGSLANRARLLLDVVRAVRVVLGPDRPMLVRFSASDWVPGGWDAEQTAIVAGWARDAGADFFDISSGGLVPEQRPTTGPGYQVPLAEEVRARAGVPASAVGLLTDPHQFAELVDGGRVDAVMAGRAALREPHLPLRVARELGVEVPWPAQYRRANV